MGSSSNRMRSAMGRHPLLSVRAYQPRTDLMPKVPSGRMYSLGECIKSLDADRACPILADTQIQTPKSDSDAGRDAFLTRRASHILKGTHSEGSIFLREERHASHQEGIKHSCRQCALHVLGAYMLLFGKPGCGCWRLKGMDGSWCHMSSYRGTCCK
eukprot:1156330-Pelagomonas_calceolata.AAC.3